MFPTWCRWPLFGLFLLFGAVAYGGFGCDKTDPGVTTNPGVTIETQAEDPALADAAPSRASIPMAAIGVLPLAGGLVASVLARRDT